MIHRYSSPIEEITPLSGCLRPLVGVCADFIQEEFCRSPYAIHGRRLDYDYDGATGLTGADVYYVATTLCPRTDTGRGTRTPRRERTAAVPSRP
jgi:hypothetical protein